MKVASAHHKVSGRMSGARWYTLRKGKANAQKQISAKTI